MSDPEFAMGLDFVTLDAPSAPTPTQQLLTEVTMCQQNVDVQNTTLGGEGHSL